MAGISTEIYRLGRSNITMNWGISHETTAVAITSPLLISLLSVQLPPTKSVSIDTRAMELDNLDIKVNATATSTNIAGCVRSMNHCVLGHAYHVLRFWQSETIGFDACTTAAMAPDGSVVLAGMTSGVWNGKYAGGHSDFAAVKLGATGKEEWRWQARQEIIFGDRSFASL